MQSTNVNRKFIGGLAALVATILVAPSIVKADAPTISGYIDTQYVYSFMKPMNQTNALRSFDAKDNNISLNAAQLMVAGSLGEASYVVKFLTGSDALTLTSGGSGAADDFDLQEAYIVNKFGSGFGFKVGKFVTTEGIEVIESKDNPTISRGYLFGLAEAYTHVGGLATFAAGKFDFAAGIVNGWDLTSDNNKGKTAAAKIGYTSDSLVLVLSGLSGPEQAGNVGNNRDSIDLTGALKMIPKTALWFQLNAGQEEMVADNDGDTVADDLGTWKGFAVEPVITFTDKFSIGARGEYFYDKQGVRTAAGFTRVAAKNFTITPAFKTTENTTIRLEYRYDNANKKLFTDDEGVAKDNNSTVSAQFLLTF